MLPVEPNLPSSEKFSAKLFLDVPRPPERERLIETFHSWIQNDVLDAMLIDVVDYSHVHRGPGVMLMSHQGSWSVNHSDGESGLSFQHRRPVPKTWSLERRIADAVANAVEGCVQLKASIDGVQFRTDWFDLRIVDRLNAPNNLATIQAVEPTLRALGKALFGGDVLITPLPGSRRTLGIRVTGSQGTSLNTLRCRARTLAELPIGAPNMN